MCFKTMRKLVLNYARSSRTHPLHKMRPHCTGEDDTLGPKGVEVKKKGLQNITQPGVCSLLLAIQYGFKAWRIWWTRHVARRREREAYTTIWVEKTPLHNPRDYSEDIRRDLREMGVDCRVWIHLDRNRSKRRLPMNMIMKLRDLYKASFLVQMNDCQLLNKYSILWSSLFMKHDGSESSHKNLATYHSWAHLVQLSYCSM
jgi:hypothetical protein